MCNLARHLVQLLVILIVSRRCVSEVALAENIEKTIKFDGEDLKFRLENENTKTGIVVICMKSTPNTVTADCPKGYASFRTPLTASKKQETFIINRQSVANKREIIVHGTIVFNDDDSVNILVVSLPEGIGFTLENAEEVTPKSSSTTTMTATIHTTTSKSISTGAIIGIVCGTISIVLLLLSIGLLVWLCIIRKRQFNYQAVPTVNPEEGQPRPTEETNQNQKRTKVARILSAASKQTSTTTTTKPSNETSKDKATAEPLIATTIETVETEEAPVKQEKSVENPKTAKHETAPKKALKPQKKPSEVKATKGHPDPVETPQTLPTVTQEAKSPLTLDKTQSVSPTTEPTPKFGTDATAKALAANSKLNPRQYLPRNEAPVPGSTVKRRPARIADEVDEFRRATETYPCFAQRMKLFSGHDHMKIAERINVTINHVPSDAERSLLKASPEDAPKWADIVREEANKRMDQFSLYHDHQEIAFEEPGVFWQYANNPATPASDAYIIMCILLPAIYKPKKYALSDPLIRGMPLCGLYTLLLDPTLHYNFRVALAKEIRQKASRIIPSLQRDMFQNAAFPTSYLALAYSKNEASFIEGSEIHSKKATTTQQGVRGEGLKAGFEGISALGRTAESKLLKIIEDREAT